MRNIFLLFTLLLTYSSIFSQTPGLQWQRSLGGSNKDVANFSFLTQDGGTITVGSTLSNNGIVSSNHGGEDVWVFKLSKNGSLEWSKCFGGSGTDVPIDAVYKNGTLTIAASSNSTNGNITNNHGNTDFWILQIDGSGNLIWQNSFGGSGNDACNNIITVAAGGFAVSGYTNSSDGDVTAYHGGQDLWVLYISDSGSLQWQKALGGSSGEVSRQSRIIESSGSFIIATETFSNDGDVSGLAGQNDIWVVKLNNTGALQWQKCLGGTSFEYITDIKEASNGDIYVFGTSYSAAIPSFHGVNGDYTDVYLCQLSSTGTIIQQKCFGSNLNDTPIQMVLQPDGVVFCANVVNQSGDVSGLHGAGDIWMVKVKTDFTIDWQKALGGSDNDGTEPGFTPNYKKSTGRFIQTSDGNFLISGYTESPNDGDVTGYHPNPNPLDTARADLWVVKLTNTGNLDWQRTYGGSKGEWPRSSPLEMSPNEFIITAFTNSSDYNVTGANGSFDAWILKVGPVNTIKGTVFIDNNLNGNKDAGEPFFSNVIVTSAKATDSTSSVASGGKFNNEVGTGTYFTYITLGLPYYNVVPSSVSSTFTTYFNKDSISFALQPIPNKQDLVVSLIPVTGARPGFTSPYRIFYRNVGTTTIASGEILFKKDSRTSLVSSLPSVSNTNGDTLKWTYNNFAPGDTASVLINLQVATPPTVNVGDTLAYMAIIIPVAGDETPANDTAILKQRTVGAIDPNDKTENNGGLITSSFITDGSYLQYTVRFQNTGTADAINVIVRDTLGNRVDLSTLEVVTSSHPYALSIENGNELTWTFNNIMLPASSVNEPASHGYIVYRIKPKSDVVVGETIHNTASIYFDYNLPVLTNDALTLVQDNFSALPVKLINFTGQLANNTVQLKWQTANETNFERFEVERSFDGAAFNKIGSIAFADRKHDYNTTDNVAALTSKHIFYRLKLVDADGKFSYSKVIAFNINANQQRLTVYPNPANTEIFVSITADRKSNLQIKIVDASGRTVSEEQKTIDKGNNVFPVNTSKLKKGNYLLQIVAGEETKTTKFIIMK